MFSSPNMIRANLEPYEWVEERQIYALFSQWSKKYWEGNLHEPAQLQVQMVTMSIRKIMKTVMTVMIMKKNKVVNCFNKLKVFCFICYDFQ